METDELCGGCRGDRIMMSFVLALELRQFRVLGWIMEYEGNTKRGIKFNKWRGLVNSFAPCLKP